MEYAVFLRAINVGGRSKLPMTDLRNLCLDLGLSQVKTYIQSGNLTCQSEVSADVLQDKLETALKLHLGQAVPVVLRTRAELTEILATAPFGAQPDGTLHISLFHSAPTRDRLELLEEFDSSRDRFRVIGREGYLLCPATYNDTPFSNAALEKVLGVKATTRKRDTLVATAALFA